MSLLIPIQFILIAFVFFAASRAYFRFRGGSLQFGAFIFWLFIWGSAAFFIFFPDETTKIARLVGIGRGADIIMYASAALLFYLVYRLHVLMESLRTEMSKLVREVSLKEVEEKS